MDIATIVKEAVDKLLNDKALLEAFKKDPIGTVEKKLGIDLPNDQIEAVVKGIQAKIGVDDAVGMLGKLKGLLGKK